MKWATATSCSALPNSASTCPSTTSSARPRGACIVLPDPARGNDPSHWAELMVRHRVTLWNSVPAQGQMLIDYLEGEPALDVPAAPRAVVGRLDSGDAARALVATLARQRVVQPGRRDRGVDLVDRASDPCSGHAACQHSVRPRADRADDGSARRTRPAVPARRARRDPCRRVGPRRVTRTIPCARPNASSVIATGAGCIAPAILAACAPTVRSNSSGGRTIR